MPDVFESRLELFARADTTEQVLQGAAVLLARLIAWCQAQHAQVRRFTLLMQHESRHRHDATTPADSHLDVALAEPSADAAHLLVLLRERLAQLQLVAPTLELRLQCDDVARRGPPNRELFPTPSNEREGLVRLIERLQARLGNDRVHRLVRVEDHRPERATRVLPAEIMAGHLTDMTHIHPRKAAISSAGSVETGSRAAGSALSGMATTGVIKMATTKTGITKTATTKTGITKTGEAAKGNARTNAARTDPTSGSTTGSDRARTAGAPGIGISEKIPSTGSRSIVSPPSPPPSSHPVWLLAAPEPLREHQSRPLLEGRPLQLLSGPERIESGWWDGALAERDYFVAQTVDGSLVWLFRGRLPDARSGAPPGWFLHGFFG